jgi:putative ABC transport system permease protein
MAKIQGGLQKFVPGSIMVSAASSEDVARAEKQITNLLRDRHHISPPVATTTSPSAI